MQRDNEGISMAVRSEQSGDLMRRSQTMINQAVDRGTSLLADRVEHYTNVAREVGDVLRERGEPQAADLVQGLAQRGQDAARYFRSRDGVALWSDAQDFARGKTWLMAGAGLVGGLAVARAVRTATDSNWESTSAYVDSYAAPNTVEGREMERDYERT